MKCVDLCSNDSMGTRNILLTTNHRHSKYPENFNNVREGKKSGSEIAYGRTHSYGSLAFELSRFHCNTLRVTGENRKSITGRIVALADAM